MLFPENLRLPRDPDTLMREVDAAIRIKDIEAVQKYRDQLELKWWESGIIVMLFISGLGIIITIYKLIPAENNLLFWFVFFWFLLFTITLLAAVEFLIFKIAALRRLYEINSRILERIERAQEPSSPDNS